MAAVLPTEYLEDLEADEAELGIHLLQEAPRAEMVFTPADPPRNGEFALFVPPGGEAGSMSGDETGGESSGGAGWELEIAWPVGRSIRSRWVPARYLSVAEGLDYLLGGDGVGSASTAAWRVALQAGLAFLARGRLFPAVTPEGHDAWRAGPFDPADHRLIEEIAAAMPPSACCVPVGDGSPLRVTSPVPAVRALWDALADTLVRTPAAEAVAGGQLFAGRDTHDARELAGWLAETGAGMEGGVKVGLRIALHGAAPDETAADEEWPVLDGDGELDGPVGVVQVSSVADPSLVVSAAELFRLPAAVLARMGDDAETELLLGLRRGARAWPPLSPLLAQATPSRLPLSDDEVEDLLTGGAADALAAAGIEVLWPSSLLLHGLTLQAKAIAPPKVDGTAGFSLRELVKFRWQLALGGEALTEEELDQLAEAKRSLVRIRGKWVALDPALLARAGTTREQSAMEALAALLAGEMTVDGTSMAVVAEGEIASFVERLRSIGEGGTSQLGPPPGLAGELRHYQERGVNWLHTMCELGLGGCLADDMGLGKTVQVIGLHLHRCAMVERAMGEVNHAVGASTLIICPTSLLGNWSREVARFAPSTPFRRYYGPGRDLENIAPGEVVITSYGVARRDQELLGEAGFSLVVADEAQHAKNPHSETAKALRTIASDSKSLRVALTGTPVENRLSELWSILDWTTPGLLGPLQRFQKTIATPVERHRDPAVTERLNRTVRPFLLRRKKTDPAVAPDLPPRIVTDLPVGLTAEQVTLYEAEVREALEAIEGKKGIERMGLVLRMLTVLKQICNHPANYLHQSGPIKGRSGKLAAFEELIDVIVSEGESVLVFSQYVEMCSLLETRLSQLGVPTIFLHGKVPVKRREEMVAAFQAGRAPVFLLSLKAGGVGLNLTRATHVIHYDRWWNPAVEDQATDRAHRIGQDHPVQVHRLIAEGTMEDRIAKLLESKRDLAEKVVGEGEAWIADMTNDQLADLVALGSS